MFSKIRAVLHCAMYAATASDKLRGVYEKMQTFGIDQQGGKGNASWTRDVAPTLLHDSHGTPHAVALLCPQKVGVPRRLSALCFISGNGPKARSLGCHCETCITLGTKGGAEFLSATGGTDG